MAKKKTILGLSKRLIVIALVLGLILTVYLIVAYNRAWFPFISFNARANHEKRLTAVSEAFQQKENSCSEANVNTAESAYNGETDDSKKAILAEQIATCKNVNLDYDGAITWFNKAADTYESLGDEAKAKLQREQAEHAENIKNTPSVVNADKPEKEGME